VCAVAARGLNASTLVLVAFTAVYKGRWPPFRSHWYDYLLCGAAASPPRAAIPVGRHWTVSLVERTGVMLRALAGTFGVVADSVHAQAVIIDAVLHLRDSPLAGECAAIVKAKNPDARSAPRLPMPARAPRLRSASREAMSLHRTTCTGASGQQRSGCRRIVAVSALRAAAEHSVRLCTGGQAEAGTLTRPACGRLDGIAGSLGLRITDAPARAGAKLSRGAADSVATAATAAEARETLRLRAGAGPAAAARPAAPAAGARGRPGSPSPGEDGWGDGAAWGSLDGDLKSVDAAASRAASQAEAWGRQREAGAGRRWHPGMGGGGGQREAGDWHAPGGREDAPGTGGGADLQGDPLGAWSMEDAWSPPAREQMGDEGRGPAGDVRDAELGTAPATGHARRWARRPQAHTHAPWWRPDAARGCCAAAWTA
jgi:hypothetical protein